MKTFSKNGITLIHGDCMDVMKELEDKQFSLALVDPPYSDANFQNPPHLVSGTEVLGSTSTNAQMGGVQSQAQSDNSQEGLRDTNPRNSRPLRFHGGDRWNKYLRPQLPPHTQCADNQPKSIWWDIAPSQEYFDELFRVSKNQVIWGGNYFWLPPTRCFLIWRKLTISEKFSMAMCEYAWTSFQANAKVFEAAPQGTAKEPRWHPTAKPVSLYAWILNNYAKQGDTILDTHLGSGSSAIAAYELGFEFTGIEIDKEYYDKAVERLKRKMAQGKLF